jgi:hypothetical protein
MGENAAVFGIYSTALDARHAIDTLIEAGFAVSHISLLVPDARRTTDFAYYVDGASGGFAGVSLFVVPCVGHAKSSAIVLSVHCDTPDEISRSMDILADTGAEDVATVSDRTLPTEMPIAVS